MFSEEAQQVQKNAPPPTTPLQVSLTSEENMYSNLRDLNFRAVGRFLSKQAQEISAAFEVNIPAVFWPYSRDTFLGET